MSAFNSTLPSIPSNIAFLTGPPLLGIMLNWCLLGILIVQIYVYRLHFHNDKTWLKSFGILSSLLVGHFTDDVVFIVYILFFLEMIQTGLSTADAFHWFAYGFGNMNTLGTAYISAFDAPIMNSFMAFMVQLFYSWRLWILSKSRVLVMVIVIVGGTQAIGGLVMGVQTAIDNRVSAKEVPSLTVWLVGSVVADAVIAVGMTYYLLKARRNIRRTGKTDDIILRIVRLTIETNSLSAGIAIITLATYIAFPNNNLSFCPSYVLGKVYTNSVMVGLNNRIYQSWKDTGTSTIANIQDLGNLEDTQNTDPKTSPQGIVYSRETVVTTDIHLEDLRGTVSVLKGMTPEEYSQV
ncbi:hypothetical protein BDZ94DRAFT_1311674 [Collybia nuda]|uniref:DUF6534 domain-containing protein n=1 Tax=Collybia nuda TaxID=64659 RepID=A0A9P5Y132_9AGAR|nr:hypothetical protein BDZ94DRAFT_1311674 [Collybia nuda]